MSRTEVERTIAASPEAVFDTVAHIDNFSQVVDAITDVEFLSDTTRGVGTRFRETRLMRGREATTTLEVTEYTPNERIRLVADEGGTVWDTIFTVAPDGDGTNLRMVMNASPHTLMAKLTVALFGRMIKKAIESDMDAVKRHCEASGA